MKFAFVSKTGDSIPIAHRVSAEGHSVVVMIDDQAYREARVGEGFVTLGPRPSLSAVMGEKPDCVVFDMVGYGELAGALRAAGVPVFGAALWADVIELNRPYGTALMAACGIKTPKTYVFKSLDEGIAFVQNHPARYVFKPSGNLSTFTTYVSHGPEDLVGMMKHALRGAVGDTAEFELQEFVGGVEVSCEGWFNGSRFVEPLNITFEEKRFMEGGLGPNTGCMGNVVVPLVGRPRIVQDGIGRLEKVLRSSDYRGPLDLNSIVTRDSLFGLEFTARFGYDAVQALLEGLRGEIGELLHGVATGKSNKMQLVHEYLIAVRLTVPPYPHEERPGGVNVPVFGVTDGAAKHLWPSGLRIEAGQPIGCSPDGNLLAVTAWGSTVREARRRVYRTVERLVIPDVQYRRDIGERVERDMAQLREWGWV